MVEPLRDPHRRDLRPRGFLRPVSMSREHLSPALGKPCRCGHGKRAHEHYRAGSDCALCSCQKFRRSLLRLLLGR